MNDDDQKKSNIRVKWKKWIAIAMIQLALLGFGIFFGVRLNDALQGKTQWLDVILLFLGFITMMGGFYTIENHVKKKKLIQAQLKSKSSDLDDDDDLLSAFE